MADRSVGRTPRIPVAKEPIRTSEGGGDAKRDPLKPHKTIRIAPTGDIRVTMLEVDLVDTDAFQRLRGIRQLGTTNLVYPTAVHTRFDHALGTLAMAAQIVSAIRANM